MAGPSGFQMDDGSFSITQAPLTLPASAASSWALEASTLTTGPLSARPPVPAVQAQLWAVTSLLNGARMRAVTGPRSQATPNVQGSSWPVSPQPLNCCSVQSLARFIAGELVSRGPMTSVRYSAVFMTCERSIACAMMAPDPA